MPHKGLDVPEKRETYVHKGAGLPFIIRVPLYLFVLSTISSSASCPCILSFKCNRAASSFLLALALLGQPLEGNINVDLVLG